MLAAQINKRQNGLREGIIRDIFKGQKRSRKNNYNLEV